MRNSRTRFFAVLIVLGLLVLGIVYYTVSSQLVEQGIEKIESISDFDELKAASVNKKDIKLKVNKKSVHPNTGKYFMSNNMNLMIPIDVIERDLNCACLKYKGNTVVVIKGNSKAILKINGNKVKINGIDYSITDDVVKKKGVIYIPSSLFEKYLGYAYSFDTTINEASLTDTALGNALPSKYNYAEEARLPKVQNQGNERTCWAYATMSALESSLMPTENYDFSVQHLVDYSKKTNDIRNGGDYEFSLAYLLSWNGPVTKYNNGGGTVKKHVQSAQHLTPGDDEEIKRMVFKYGGVEASIYLQQGVSLGTSPYYNEAKSAYYFTGANNPNHDVVIVGWDDNFAKENFNGNAKNDGAFICLNSWGKNFGEGGLFYVSYDSNSFAEVTLCYTQVENADNYDDIYQSDLCGFTGTLGYKNKNNVYFSNAFAAKKNEKIKSVGFYATEEKTEYEVFVCENFEGVKSLNNRGHVAAKVKFDNKGYYTVDLDKAYKIQKGKKFSIIVKAKTKGKGLKIVPVEIKTKSMKKDIVLNDGEGYTSADGETWQSAESQKCNVCIKAYAVK